MWWGTSAISENNTNFYSSYCSPTKSRPDQRPGQDFTDKNPKIPDHYSVGNLTPNSVQHTSTVDEQAVFHSNYHWDKGLDKQNS